MSKQRGLGKGLDALFITDPTEISAPVTLSPTELNIEQLVPGKYQPREHMDEGALTELSESIRAQGVLQPLLVRPIADKVDRYEIIAGERRWRASRLAGLTQVPVVIKSLTDSEALQIGLVENIQRKDLNPLEKGRGLQRLIKEFGLKQQDLADRLGQPRSTIGNLLRLMTLNFEVQAEMEKGHLDFGHAKALLALNGEMQTEAAHMVIKKELSVRETEDLVKRLQISTAIISKKTPPTPVWLKDCQDRISEQYEMKVKFQQRSSGKGKIVMHYKTEAALRRFLAQVIPEEDVDQQAV